MKTSELGRMCIDNIYRLYGLPADIVSDRDAKFTSHFWQAVFKQLDTQFKYEYCGSSTK